MNVQPDLLHRRRSHFALWLPAQQVGPEAAPVLVIGKFQDGIPASLVSVVRLPLATASGTSSLWVRPLSDCDLDTGVYHYWFEVTDTQPAGAGGRILVSDPTAWTVDWRLLSSVPDGYSDEDRYPASVVGVANGALFPCDPAGERPDAEWGGEPDIATLAPNNRLVIYELPTQWTRLASAGMTEMPNGTFQDVVALLDSDAMPPNFPDVDPLAKGRAYLAELGINALELLPIADSFVTVGWKYATSNYFAPDHTLGLPEGASSPTANRDVARLVATCHRQGVRFFLDAVMGFSRRDPYRHADTLPTHVQWSAPSDPSREPELDDRNAWGGDLWKYAWPTPDYDPVSGNCGQSIFPARQHMLCFIARWLLDQHIDGVRVDSVDTIHNWDFVGEFTAQVRQIFRERAAAEGLSVGDADARILVVGEELHMPRGLVGKHLDALWNDTFKYALRAAILGRSHDGDASFEDTVRKIVDCRGRIADFSDGAQAVNYVTSHDVGNYGSERLYNYLSNNGIIDTAPRIRLALCCLFTAVGIPMIFVGEEFADQQDKPIGDKETDPVNFNRLSDPWRHDLFTHTQRLVALRTSSAALSVNDTEIIHTDFTPGRRVMAWRRGRPQDPPVVVVANFSDWQTDDPTNPSSEYRIPNWPPTLPGSTWREVTQDRDIPPDWVGREPLYAWETKVYTTA